MRAKTPLGLAMNETLSVFWALKKYPLTLVVTNEARFKEVSALVAAAGLFANVSVNTSNGATESIEALTLLLNKTNAQKTVANAVKIPARNEMCSCGSGKKYKKCCG